MGKKNKNFEKLKDKKIINSLFEVEYFLNKSIKTKKIINIVNNINSLNKDNDCKH